MLMCVLDDYNCNAQMAALELVSELIGKDWERLADCLGMKKPPLSFIKRNKVNMLDCFKSQNFNIPWQELKKQLKLIKRKDIIDTVIEQTTLTIGK